MMFRGGFNGFGNCFGAGYGLMHGGWGMIIMLGIFVLAQQPSSLLQERQDAGISTARLWKR